MRKKIKRGIARFTAGLIAITSIPTLVSAEYADTWNGINPDINSDGEINALDASYVLVYAAENGAGNVSSFEEYMTNYFSSGTEWQSLYLDVIDQFGDSHAEENLPWQYKLAYIDTDDIPELLVMCYGEVHYYTVDNNEAIEFLTSVAQAPYLSMGTNEYCGYIPKSGIILTTSPHALSHSNGSDDFVYSLKNGKAELIATYVTELAGESNSYEFNYYIDGEQVTESEFNESLSVYFSQIDMDETTLSYDELKTELSIVSDTSTSRSSENINPDLNGDGEINASDASYILVYAAENGAGNINRFSEFMEQYFGEGTQETVNWWISYADRIKSYGSDTDMQFAFIYLDDNDVPELLEFDSNNQAMITFVNEDSCITSENIYYLYGSGYDERQGIVYCFEDLGGELLYTAKLYESELEEHQFQSIPLSDDYGLTGEYDYYIDTIQVTKVEYEQLRSEFIHEDAEHTYLSSLNRMTCSEALTYLDSFTHQDEVFNDELALFDDILRNPESYPEVWNIYNKNDAISYSVIDLDGNGQYELIIGNLLFSGSYTSMTVVQLSSNEIKISHPKDLFGQLTFFDNGVILADFSGSTINYFTFNITDLSGWSAYTEKLAIDTYEFYAYPCNPETGEIFEDKMLTGKEAELKIADICSSTPLDMQFTEYDLSDPDSFNTLIVIDNLDEIRLT
ncbi:MAG: hypothetical protein HDT22_02315 [Ruminococcus sp.]|nr:hypothetical protein [Ruminococcus sp.]